MGVLDALLEGFAAPAAPDPFDGQAFTAGDQVRVSVGGGASSITGKVIRPHGGPPATHAVVAPEGGGAHVLAPIGQVKLNSPAQHAAAAKRQERQEAKAQQDQATAAWMASKPPNAKIPVAGKPPRVREGLELVLGEAFVASLVAKPGETPAQSQAIGAQQAKQAQAAVSASWNAAKHPRARGGRFGYTTGGKRARRGQASSSRTLGVGARGALVRSIQGRVGATVDGQYGPNTKAAVERFQRQHGLQVDGVVGAQTLAALRGHPRPVSVKPGPIGSRQATLKPAKARGKAKAPAGAKAPVRVAGTRLGGGVIV